MHYHRFLQDFSAHAEQEEEESDGDGREAAGFGCDKDDEQSGTTPAPGSIQWIDL